MTLPEIRERVIRLPSAGIITDETRADFPYIDSIIHSYRAILIRNLYAKDKRINPSYYQRFECEYSKDYQTERKRVLFKCPETIPMDSMSDGLRFVGNIDCSKQYRRIVNRSQLASFDSHRIMKNLNNRYVAYLYDGTQKNIEVFGNAMIEHLFVEGLFKNPTDIHTYNSEIDQYPMPDGDVSMMEEMILKGVTGVIWSKIPDYLPNSTDITPMSK
jgi:hypothetical protein